MSHKVDKIFQPMFILTSICFLRNFNLKILKNKQITFKCLSLIRIAFIVMIWYSLLRKSMPIDDIIDYSMQLMRKVCTGLNLSVAYAAANLTSRHLDQIKQLMKNSSHICGNITSLFIRIYATLFTMYSIIVAIEFQQVRVTGWVIYTKDQFFIMIFGGFIHGVFISIFYSIGSLIFQQFRELNIKLFNFENKDKKFLENFSKLSQIYSNLYKQSESYNSGFGLYILFMFFTSQAYIIFTCYYCVIVTNYLSLYTVFWIGFVCGELMLIVYTCDRIKYEVITRVHNY